jgi:hypothetical protein
VHITKKEKKKLRKQKTRYDILVLAATIPPPLRQHLTLGSPKETLPRSE